MLYYLLPFIQQLTYESLSTTDLGYAKAQSLTFRDVLASYIGILMLGRDSHIGPVHPSAKVQEGAKRGVVEVT
jgi:hypothetical protein